MKRDPALTTLSHDHHQALFQALRMKRVGEVDRAEVVEGVLTFWVGGGARHFRIEEELLLPAFARHRPPDDDRVVRVLIDHVWIRERIDRATELDLAEIRELGERLEKHVRHEERVLFPAIEEALDEGELAALGARIEGAEAG